MTLWSRAGGYDYKFVESNISRYACAICTLTARGPQQTRCCGNLFCNGCLRRLRYVGNNFNCPTCRVGLADNYFPDRRVDREIKSLQVFCNNMDDGCQWKGDLKDIEDHLQECPYQLVSCSNDCRMDSLQRRHLRNHLENDCPKRLIKCQYCNEDVPNDIAEDHLEICVDYPTTCTNEECGKKVPRQQMPSHKASCPKEMISCGYRSVGCEEKMKREEQEEHNEQWRERHLQLASGEVNKLNSTIADLHQKQFVFLSKLYNLEIKTNSILYSPQEPTTSNQQDYLSTSFFKLENFAKLKENTLHWHSPGFYTSPGGYKMCLRVCAHNTCTHVICGIRLMSGEYDDSLEWPFYGEVTIELLNQLEDKNHCRVVLVFDEALPQGCRNRVIGKEIAERGWGYRHFVSYSQLRSVHSSRSVNRQYLKDDTLYFRVSAKVTAPSNTSSPASSLNLCGLYFAY